MSGNSIGPAAIKGELSRSTTTGILSTRQLDKTGFYRAFGKRVFDIVVGGLLFISFLPIILILTALVALDGSSPIFGHRRIGRNGREFRCLKLRSMVPDAQEVLKTILAESQDAREQWDAMHKLENDPRITRVGHFLRKTSLDELPQFWNVIRGDMSLVGPRPVTEEELERYGSRADSYLALRPGLTGPWQISGRNDITYDERVAMDVRYERNLGPLRDLWIMLSTVKVFVRHTGK